MMMLTPTHHAYLVTGDKNFLRSEILKWAREVTGVDDAIHADHGWWEEKTWDVANSRAVKAWQNLKPQGRAKVGVIVCEAMTAAAGQALLKVLEEPASDVYFILIVPNEGVLLPTLRSRLAALALKTQTDKLDLNLAKQFLAAPAAERLKLLAEVEIKDLEKFLVQAEAMIEPKVLLAAGAAVMAARRRITNPRLPDKLALETLAFSLPVIKL